MRQQISSGAWSMYWKRQENLRSPAYLLRGEMERREFARFFREAWNSALARRVRAKWANTSEIKLDPESFVDRFDNRMSREKGEKSTRVRIFNARVDVNWSSTRFSFYFKVTRFSQMFVMANSKLDYVSYNVFFLNFHLITIIINDNRMII